MGNIRFLSKYKKECILSPLFKFLEAGIELFVPIVVQLIIDVGINGNGGKEYIFKMGGLLVLLGIVGLCFSITAQFFAAKAATLFAKDLRHELFLKIQKLSFNDLDEVGNSTLINRMTNDVNLAQNTVNMVLRLVLRSPFVVFGAMIMAFTIDFDSAMVFLIVIIALSIVVFGLMAINVKQVKNVQSKLESVLIATRENLKGVRVIRAFCKEREESIEFENDNDMLTKALNKAGNISALMNPLTYVMINVAIITLIKIDAVKVSQGSMTQGTVVALYNYMSQILVELIKLANLIVLLNKTLACSNRVSSVFDIVPSQTDGIKDAEKSNEVIRFDHVSLEYPESGEETLSDISFAVNKGETVGIIGGTGSGKTSLVHLIPRFYDATKGTVYINGLDVKEYSFENIRKKVGIVMQKAVLFKGTIRSNMEWASKSAIEDDFLNAISDAQAVEVVEQKGGIDGEVEPGGKNFSGGQRQRLSIARTLLSKPEILILDDSSSALDYLTDLNLRKAIKNLDYNPTVLIVSQRSASIMHADKIIVLDDGNMVGIGKHEELLKTCEVYKEIYESQYSEEAG